MTMTAAEKRREEDNRLKEPWQEPSPDKQKETIDGWKALEAPPNFPERIAMQTTQTDRKNFREGKWKKAELRRKPRAEEIDMDDGYESDHQDAQADRQAFEVDQELTQRSRMKRAPKEVPPSPSDGRGKRGKPQSMRQPSLRPPSTNSAATEPGLTASKLRNKIQPAPSVKHFINNLKRIRASTFVEPTNADTHAVDASQSSSTEPSDVPTSLLSRLNISPPPPSTPSSGPSQLRNPDYSADKAPAHSTGRFYYCAFLSAKGQLRCPFSDSAAHLEAAHMVPQALTEDIRRNLHRAIGGFFTRNSRLNYFLVYAIIHMQADKKDTPCWIYPIEENIIIAMQDYINNLPAEPDGLDWFQVLRLSHPLLSDGHRYQYRLIFPYDDTDEDKDFDFTVYSYKNNARTRSTSTPPLFNDVLPALSFTNPLLVTLKAIMSIEQGMGMDWDAWKGTNWELWVSSHRVLKELDQGRKAELVRFLNFATLLRLRLGESFSWSRNNAKNDGASLRTQDSEAPSTQPSTQPPPSKKSKGKARSQPQAPAAKKGKGTGRQNAMDSRTLAYEWRVENNVPIPPPVSDPAPPRNALWTLLTAPLRSAGTKENTSKEGMADGGLEKPMTKNKRKAARSFTKRTSSSLGGLRRVFGVIN